MHRLTCLGVTLYAAFAFVPSASALDMIIYQEDFSGPLGTHLNSLAPSVGYNNWNASSDLVGNGLQGVIQGYQSGFLPFTPLQGYKYSLSADVRTDDPFSFMCLGFSATPNAISPHVAFDAANGNTGWMVMTDQGHTDAFLGIDYTGQVGWQPSPNGQPGMHNLRIDLDATTADPSARTGVKLRYYIDGQLQNYNSSTPNQFMDGNTFDYPCWPADNLGYIRYVGFGGGGASSASGVIDNFKLTATLPQTLTAAPLHVTFNPGNMIYQPDMVETSLPGYRHSSSIMKAPPGQPASTVYMWASGPPPATMPWDDPPDGYWDNVYLMKSTDNGTTWTSGTLALKPTATGRDAASVCDPSVVYFGGYYYMAYDSNDTTGGSNAQLYIARSRTADFANAHKWQGNGWGTGSVQDQNPQPLIEYTGDPTKWGTGGPSMLVKDGQLYIYYGTVDENGVHNYLDTISTNDSFDSSWPSRLVHHDVTGAFDLGHSEAWDVKYVDSLRKFIAVNIHHPVDAESAVMIWESTDGVTFTPVQEMAGTTQGGGLTGINLEDYALCISISGDQNGHFDMNDPTNFISYGYDQFDGLHWGRQAAYVNPITIQANGMFPIPEPGTFSMACAGALALLPLLRRWRRDRNGK